jgi:sugar phosphate permease
MLGLREVRMTPLERDVSINMSGISVSGVGGLGLVAIAALTAYVLPQAWWLVAFGAAGGAVLGLAIVTFRRHHRAPGPSGDDPTILFRAEAGAEPARRAFEHWHRRTQELPAR